ncbi:hypothetical protein AVEN_62465-1 [Araneus ventricosus]|uniref:Uncharacterized protein n=1 Tax=Araneus ventricosus TaxID=182803 RepID=A0A4Y2NN14_ARAVE|nr:hypothetical protein AVEN_62465-1 [Araneus ventricosus]
MEGDAWHAIIDDISRGQTVSHELKIVEFGPVTGAGGLSHGFPHRECTVLIFFRFLSKMEGGEWQATIDDIFRRHNLSIGKKKLSTLLAQGALQHCYDIFTTLYGILNIEQHRIDTV